VIQSNLWQKMESPLNFSFNNTILRIIIEDLKVCHFRDHYLDVAQQRQLSMIGPIKFNNLNKFSFK